MTVKSKLLATLSSLAFGTVAIAGTAATYESAYAQQTDFFGLVTALSEACLIETTAGYEVVVSPVGIARCCAIVRALGPENVDFLRAVALANPADPRLVVLDDRIVEVLLSCQQDALERLGQLALNTNTGAGPVNNQGPPIYVG